MEPGAPRLYGIGGWGTPINGFEPLALWRDHPPRGESSLRAGTPVLVGNDTVGHLDGLIVGPDDQVTAVLVASGHPWSRRTMGIPVDAVVRIDGGGIIIADTWGDGPTSGPREVPPATSA
jgi:hypothetical protein